MINFPDVRRRTLSSLASSGQLNTSGDRGLRGGFGVEICYREMFVENIVLFASARNGVNGFRIVGKAWPLG